MKVKVIRCEDFSGYDIQEKLNDWLEYNKLKKIKHIFQTETSNYSGHRTRTFLTISIWYED